MWGCGYGEEDYEFPEEEMDRYVESDMYDEDVINSADFWLSIYRSDKEKLWTWYSESQSNDDEFFQSVKEQYIAAARETCGSDLPELETASANYDERGTYTITAETDSTGNNIETETIKLSEQYNNNLKISATDSITFSSTLSPQAILESYYGGYTYKKMETITHL
jgi:hypothetical protein